MAESQKIPLASDFTLAIILSDADGYIVAPDSLHTRIRASVADCSLIADCNDIDGIYRHCMTTSVTLPVIDEDGRLRLPASGEDGTPSAVSCIALSIPAYTFPAPGVLRLASCIVLPDDSYPDRYADIWLPEKMTTYKYVRQ